MQIPFLPAIFVSQAAVKMRQKKEKFLSPLLRAEVPKLFPSPVHSHGNGWLGSDAQLRGEEKKGD